MSNTGHRVSVIIYEDDLFRFEFDNCGSFYLFDLEEPRVWIIDNYLDEDSEKIIMEAWRYVPDYFTEKQRKALCKVVRICLSGKLPIYYKAISKVFPIKVSVY